MKHWLNSFIWGLVPVPFAVLAMVTIHKAPWNFCVVFLLGSISKHLSLAARDASERRERRDDEHKNYRPPNYRSAP